jgi:transcriptional regulator with XRE-family HTH domain
MNASAETTPVLERHLLLQLGDRLRRLRQAQGVTTVALAQQLGISRTTLAAIETGDPGTAIGTYLRVMSVLGVAGDLALLAGDTFQAAPPGTAAARSRRRRPQVQVAIRTDDAQHQAQDLQSLALHTEAIRRLKHSPDLVMRAAETLERWRSQDPRSRSRPLWDEWDAILRDGLWRKALGRTRRAQELRQASPLPTLLPDDVRQQILGQVQALKRGITLGDPDPNAP